MITIAKFVKERRKAAKLNQAEFADRAGVALTVIRKIEQGKGNLNLATVNQVLKMFGHELAPVNSKELAFRKEEDKP
jgi:y4mF family transcriptional regulator